MDGSVAMVRHKTMKASRDEAEVNVCRRLRQQQQVGSVAARLWNAWAANTVRVVHEYVCAGLQILASRVCDAVRGIAGAGDRVEWKVASVAHDRELLVGERLLRQTPPPWAPRHAARRR